MFPNSKTNLSGFLIFLILILIKFKIIDKINFAINSFYKKKFKIAQTTFEELSNTNINDGIIELYISLCKKYISMDLPENWEIFEQFEF